MKTYSFFDEPVKVSGVPLFIDGCPGRLPDYIREQLPNLSSHGVHCTGGRMALRTDSPTFCVRLQLRTNSVDSGMSLYSAQSAQVMVGERNNCRHLGVVNPRNYQALTAEKTFHKSSEPEMITVYFPPHETIERIEIEVEDGATVSAPTPYRCEKPVVFYGSSITAGACSCNISNAYNSILSRWLDFDYYNLGFGGQAKGELIIADYINTFDMSAFVFDYDHNAPTPEHLAATHKPFFDRIRQANPHLPILMMSKPAEVYSDADKARREIIRATYESALAAGDAKVWFIDGETFYGETDRNLCAVDNCHPNDLGFFRMATVIRPVLEEMLYPKRP